MAVTGKIFKSLTFNGESSRTYGVYITGEAVYNAPSRDVEMITIPGRNGSFPLDHGRFENIEVTYPAGVFADNEADFAAAISDFRNMLCAAKGYCRLEDEYNPDEYRMAIYKSGLEVEPSMLKAGEFEITFECKPQRFLKSGETAQAVTDGGTITNPTRFDASPLLQVYGYGTITINGETIEIENIPIGDITLVSERKNVDSKSTTSVTFNVDSLNAGDTITVDEVMFSTKVKVSGGKFLSTLSPTGSQTNCVLTTNSPYVRVATKPATFNKGTSATFTATASYKVEFTDSTSYTATKTATVAYNGSNKITLTITDNESSSYITITPMTIKTPYVYADSTMSATGNPAYIDLDIGEAWNEDSGVPTSIDRGVILPAKLSVLSPGSNSVTYTNTVTTLEIVPRWWKI